MRARSICAFALLLLAAGCVDTGQERTSIPLWVAGVARTEPLVAVGGWSVELTRAQLAVGPLYLCAGYQAGSMCETARMEWLESAVIDALEPEPTRVGALQGVTGPVRSWMYELGFASLLTQQSPQMLSAAEALGGHSVRLEGTATKDAQSIAFSLELPIRQEEATELGVPVVRKSGSDEFWRDISGDEQALTVRFDPAPWVRDIDFNAAVDGAAGAPSAEFAPESQGYRAVRNAVVSGARPTFEWSDDP